MVLAVLLGGVSLVMVGEQAQEMHVVKWIFTTNIPALNAWMPDWLGLWFSVFPTVKTLVAQALAAALFVGSLFLPQKQIRSIWQFWIKSHRNFEQINRKSPLAGFCR